MQSVSASIQQLLGGLSLGGQTVQQTKDETTEEAKKARALAGASPAVRLLFGTSNATTGFGF